MSELANSKPQLPEAFFKQGDGPAPLGLGCWAIGGYQWGTSGDDELSKEMLRTAYDEGLRHWDSARGYGRSETLCGEVIREKGPVFITSKMMVAKTPKKMDEAIEKSLSSLGLGCVDLYYLHWPRSEIDPRPSMECLEKARQDGRIRFIGVSNFDINDMEQVSEVGKIDVHQLNYSLFWRYPEREILPYCNEKGIQVVTYSSIAQGILTGKFPRNPQFDEGDVRPKTFYFRPDVWPHLFEAVEALKELAHRENCNLLDMAIQWVQNQPFVHSVLVGARSRNQLLENLEATKRMVKAEVFAEMSAIAEAVSKHLPEPEHNLFGFKP